MDSTDERTPDGASARLVSALAAGSELPGLTVRTFAELPSELLAGPLVERSITADQTNASVIVGERVVVKWIQPPTTARAPDLMAHLLATGFTRAPIPFAAVLRGDELVAIVTAYLPDARDGWEWCVADVLDELDGGPAAAFPADLGTLAADLHAALVTPSTVIASPVRREPPRTQWPALLGEARELALAAGDDDGRWFAAQVPAISAEISAAWRRGGREPVTVFQAHGDLHVGQVLRWRGGYAVIDFDGNPTTPPDSTWLPAVRDVAQLRTSLLHVGQIADRRTDGRHRQELLDWARRAADGLLAAYRAGLAERGRADLFDERLLRPYEIEQECRELVYAARFLPRWRYAPMGVLRSWYP